MKRTKQSTFAKRERSEKATGFAPVAWINDNAPRLSDCERAAINALDPSLTPLCVSFVGMQETPSLSFGLYNIEEAIDDNLVLCSTVSLQTLAAFGYRPVLV